MLCIIQSRMSSNRLPGKVMMNVFGKKLLWRVIDRVSQSNKITKIVIATSSKSDDDAIELFCNEEGIECLRGDLDNVANRFFEVLINKRESSFVRINGDSPLIDPGIIDIAIDKFNNSNYDIVTNVFPRTFPKGQSVEVISAQAFFELIESGLNNDQKEHVTKKFYDLPDKFKILNFSSGGKHSDINMCIDDIMDKLRLEKVIEKVGTKNLNWRELCNYF